MGHTSPRPHPVPAPAAPPPRVRRLEPETVTVSVWEALKRGSLVAQSGAAAIQLIGPGSTTCFQGLLTNDIEEPGNGAFVYGALLTPKGMIIVDGWASRLDATVRFTVPEEGREGCLAVLTRSIPPRLARVVDRTSDLAILRLAGPRTLEFAEAAGFSPPASPGHTSEQHDIEVARPGDGAPFVIQIAVPEAMAASVVERLVRAGAVDAPADALELSRVLAGWPRLAAEVDTRTIPQEVRYDEIAGVSYTKGCYTGQETVSRLHFRGHANRGLRGLEFESAPTALDPMLVTQGGREVGRVTSVAALPENGWIGLAMLRGDVEAGSAVEAGDVIAYVRALPFNINGRPR